LEAFGVFSREPRFVAAYFLACACASRPFSDASISRFGFADAFSMH